MLSKPLILSLDRCMLEDNPEFLAKLLDAPLPHLGKEDEPCLRQLLCKAIAIPSTHVSVLEFIDTLWSKTISIDSNHKQVIKYLYVDIHENMPKVNDLNLVDTIIRTGILRHVKAMLGIINDPSHTHVPDRYTQSKLIEWTVCLNVNVNEIHILKDINREHLLLVKKWYEKRQYFTSKIKHVSIQKSHLSQQLPESIQGSIMPKILEQLDNCAEMTNTDEKQNAVAWLLNKIYARLLK